MKQINVTNNYVVPVDEIIEEILDNGTLQIEEVHEDDTTKQGLRVKFASGDLFKRVGIFTERSVMLHNVESIEFVTYVQIDGLPHNYVIVNFATSENEESRYFEMALSMRESISVDYDVDYDCFNIIEDR